MRRTVCATCGELSKWRMAAFYWRWTWPTGGRRGYKQFFDSECVQYPLANLHDLDVEDDDCTECSEAVTGQLGVTVYCTYYIPGHDRQDGYMVFHEACFVGKEAQFARHGSPLADRDPSAVQGGGPPALNPWDSWDRMGITPR